MRQSKLLGTQMNDSYAKRDDGLMVASVHEQTTLELSRQVKRGGFDSAICSDTFPEASGLDPEAECPANIRTVRRMLGVVARMEGDVRLSDAQARQDPVVVQEIARRASAEATGLVAVWCRSFDSVMCSKGDELWAQSGRMNFARMRCGSR